MILARSGRMLRLHPIIRPLCCIHPCCMFSAAKIRISFYSKKLSAEQTKCLFFCPPICSVNEWGRPLNRGRLLDFVLFSCSIAYIYAIGQLDKLNARFGVELRRCPLFQKTLPNISKNVARFFRKRCSSFFQQLPVVFQNGGQ